MKICSWPVFHSFWKHNYSHIRIRKRGADTCTDCLIYLNTFARQKDESADKGSDDSDSDTDAGERMNAVIENAEDSLQKAKEHVKKYQLQRSLSKFYISVAKLDLTHHLPSLF